jgi:hypothetical protein
MPEMRHYLVTQTREVEVTANNEADAILIADAAFIHGQNRSDPSIAIGHSPVGVWGNTGTYIKIIEVNVKRTP